MPLFHFDALNTSGQPVSGDLEAVDVQSAVGELLVHLADRKEWVHRDDDGPRPPDRVRGHRVRRRVEAADRRRGAIP